MRKLLIVVLLLVSSFAARADEGMWMINMIDSALHKKMQERGLALAPGEIYNADVPGAGVADAVVSLEFGCTGSMISDNGLMITNHHCAYSDVFKMSDPDHNYLEEGYWAMTSDMEVPIPGKSVLFLKKVLDVTDEVQAVKDSLTRNDIPFGLRKLSYILERRYSKAEGLEANLSSMWAGEKYYMCLYQVYNDVRLVAAPPVCIAAFGGETDNWEWPQHKCDFALYRIYTSPEGEPAEYSEENVPLRPVRSLKISLGGYKPGDYAMVIGYPGRTDRYSGSAKINYQQNVTLPISNKVRGERMKIIEKWMNYDPEIRLKYSDFYFSLSNSQESDEGKLQCFKRFDVTGKKAALEEELQTRIDADTALTAKWGGLIQELKAKYDSVARLQANLTWYRETNVIGTRVALNAMRYRSRKFEFDLEKDAKDYDALDMRVERDLFRYCVQAYYENADSSRFGPLQKALLKEFTGENGETDFDAMTAKLWDSSFLTDFNRLTEMVQGECPAGEFAADSLNMFFADVVFGDLNREIAEAQGEVKITNLETQYKHALYEMRLDRGEPQYPDANSTMRITYGRVCDLEPYDAVVVSHRSTTAGILEKYDPDDYEFLLNDSYKTLLSAREFGKWHTSKAECEDMYVDFLTDNDITGGNSGSPVLNSRGELIGLAFDGNKESLASAAYYTADYNKSVCVDIRFVLFVLDRYAGMTRILDELQFAQGQH